MSINWAVAVPVSAAIIAACVAVWGAWMTNKAQVANRKLTRELKIAEFRQAWISQLRSKLSEYLALLTLAHQAKTVESRDERVVDLIRCAYEIQLLVKPDDPSYNELLIELGALREASRDQAVFEARSLKVVSLSQAILERGWDRIKHDLRTAEKRQSDLRVTEEIM